MKTQNSEKYLINIIIKIIMCKEYTINNKTYQK